MLSTSVRDPAEQIIMGIVHEVRSDLAIDWPGDVPSSVVRDYVERATLRHIAHEAEMAHLVMGFFVSKSQPQWFAKDTLYTDFFMESLPIEAPYTDDPESWANMFGNWAIVIIDNVLAEIREEGL